jgi:NTP pyrophosphatase (non-canonical NTP hydrolase)
LTVRQHTVNVCFPTTTGILKMNAIQQHSVSLQREVNDGSAKLEILAACDNLTALAHGNAFANGWWHDPKTGQAKERNHGELFMLMVSEISEAMEGHRKDKMDEHLPHRKSVEVELADCLIRIFDYAGQYELEIGAAFFEKLKYNNQRADHKPANRALDGGKKY